MKTIREPSIFQQSLRIWYFYRLITVCWYPIHICIKKKSFCECRSLFSIRDFIKKYEAADESEERSIKDTVHLE